MEDIYKGINLFGSVHSRGKYTDVYTEHENRRVPREYLSAGKHADSGYIGHTSKPTGTHTNSKVKTHDQPEFRTEDPRKKNINRDNRQGLSRQTSNDKISGEKQNEAGLQFKVSQIKSYSQDRREEFKVVSKELDLTSRNNSESEVVPDNPTQEKFVKRVSSSENNFHKRRSSEDIFKQENAVHQKASDKAKELKEREEKRSRDEAEAIRIAEVRKSAEEKKIAEDRNAVEARRILEEKKAAENRKIQEARKILEEKKAAEERRKEEEKKVLEVRQKEEKSKREEQIKEEEKKARRKEEEAKIKPVDSQKAVEYLLNVGKEMDKKFEGFVSDAPDHLYEDFINNDPLLLSKYQKEKEKRKNDKSFTMKQFVAHNDELKNIFVNKLKRTPNVARMFIELEASAREAMETEQIKKDLELVKFIRSDPELTTAFKKRFNDEPADSLALEKFIKEKLNEKGNKDKFEKFKLAEIEQKNYEQFVESQPELKKLLEKKINNGDVKNAKEFVEGNLALSRKYDEYREENAEEIRLKNFIESNYDMNEIYRKHRQSNSETTTKYSEFMKRNKKAQEIYNRELAQNKDHALNLQKFLAINKDARDALEVAGEGTDLKTLLSQDTNLRKAYDEFMQEQKEDTMLDNFINNNEELRKKFQKEAEKNPGIDKKQFVSQMGKQADFEKYSEAEEKRIEMHQFVQNNDVLREQFAALQRQSSKADIEDFLEKNKEVKKEFEQHQKAKQEDEDLNDFMDSRPDLQKKFDDARKKNPTLSVKDFVHKVDPKLGKDFDKHKEERQSERDRDAKDKAKQKQMAEFVQGNADLSKEFKEKQKQDPQMNVEDFLAEKSKKGDVKKELETFMLQKQEDQDYEHFVNAHPELKKVFDKKKAEGEVVSAKDFVSGNKALKKKFEEHVEENADEIRLRKFVESNPEMQRRYQEFQIKYPQYKNITYKEFLDNDKKAQEIYNRELAQNKDHALNLQKFLAINKDARDALEVAGEGTDLKTLLSQDTNLRKAYDEFMQEQKEDTMLDNFINNNEELRKKFQKEAEKNPGIDKKQFVSQMGKQADFEKYSEAEEKRIEMHQFVQNNDVLREQFAALQRQSSKADIEDFLEKNKEVKKEFEQHQKAKQEDEDLNDFMDSRPDLQKKFDDARKKNPTLSVKDFVHKVDPKLGKDFDKHKEERQSERDRDAKDKAKQKQMAEFVQGNADLSKEFKEKQKQDPQMNVEDFLAEKSKKGDVKKELETFMLQKQEDQDYEHFVNAHPELKKVFDKKKAEGEVVSAKDFVSGNKALKKKFEEHVEENADEIRLRKFVESNPEMQRRYQEFQIKYPQYKNITYKEFLDNDKKAQEIYNRELAQNKDHALNLQKFLAINKDARDALEVAGEGTDLKTLLSQDTNLRKAYDEFMQEQKEDTMLDNFINNNEELRKKFQKEAEKNPGIDKKQFVSQMGKQADFEKYSEAEEKRIEMHQFVQNNDVLREQFAALQRQSSKADIEDFLEKNKEVKKEFEQHQKAKQEDEDLNDFMDSRPDLQKKFDDARKKNPTLSVKDFVHKVDPKLGKDFDKHKEERQSERDRDAKDKAKQKQMAEFVQGNADLSKEFKEKQKQDPQMNVEDFLAEKSKKGDVKKELETFMLQKQEDQDYEHFVNAHPELKKVFDKKKAEGEVVSAKDFVSGNKALKKKFEEHVEENADEIRLRKFVESNPEMQRRYQEFQIKYPQYKNITYKEFLDNDKKAQEIYNRELAQNKDHALNLQKFLAINKDARDALEVAGEGTDLKTLLSQDTNLRKAYDEFMQEQKEDTMLDNFINNNEELRKKFQKEAEKNPGIDKKQFVSQMGKQADFEKYSEAEEKRIEMHQFVQNNDVLREQFAALQRQSSKADIEDFLEKNKEVKKEFEQHQKAKQEDEDLNDFMDSRPDLQKKFDDARKKNPTLSVKDFVHKVDPKLGKDFDKHKEERQSERDRDAKDKAKQKQMAEFVQGNADLSKEFKEKQKQDPQMNVEDFLAEKSKKGDVKKELETFMLQKQEDQDYEHFVNAHPELKKVFDKKKAEGEVVSAKDFVSGNKALKKKFEEHVEENADEIRLRKFVESNPEMQRRYQEFQIKYPQYKNITYKEFLDNDKKAQEIYNRELAQNKDHALNLQKFLAINKDARDALEVAGEGTDLKTLLSQDTNLRKAYDEFMQEQKEDTMLDNFINNNEELRKKFQKEAEKNPGIDKKQFVSQMGKQADFEKYSEAEEKRIEMHQFVQNNDVLREQFAALQRQSSKADIEDFLEKNKEVKKEFEQHQKAKQEDEDLNDFMDSRPDLQKKFDDARKKNPTLSVKDFVHKVDSQVVIDYANHQYSLRSNIGKFLLF